MRYRRLRRFAEVTRDVPEEDVVKLVEGPVDQPEEPESEEFFWDEPPEVSPEWSDELVEEQEIEDVVFDEAELDRVELMPEEVVYEIPAEQLEAEGSSEPQETRFIEPTVRSRSTTGKPSIIFKYT